MVKGIEGFGTELETHRFPDGEAFEQTQIHVA